MGQQEPVAFRVTEAIGPEGRDELLVVSGLHIGINPLGTPLQLTGCGLHLEQATD